MPFRSRHPRRTGSGIVWKPGKDPPVYRRHVCKRRRTPGRRLRPYWDRLCRRLRRRCLDPQNARPIPGSRSRIWRPLDFHVRLRLGTVGPGRFFPSGACSRAVRRSGKNGKGTYSPRSEEHTSELQSLMRISYAVFCLKKKKKPTTKNTYHLTTSQLINKQSHKSYQQRLVDHTTNESNDDHALS